MSVRNRTKEFRERCALKGVHRIVIRNGDGNLVAIFECADYAPAYRAALRYFQEHVPRPVSEAVRYWSTPATWKWEYSPAAA